MANKSNKSNKLNKPNNKKKSKKSKVKCPPDMKPVKTDKGIICTGRCTHMGGPIIYDPVSKNLKCPLHNSYFKKNGKPISGPAIKPLKIKKI